MTPFTTAEIAEIVDDFTEITLRFIRNNPGEKSLTLRVPANVSKRCTTSGFDLDEAVKEIADVAEISVKLELVR